MQIPRVFHRVWLGSHAMPQQFVAFGDSWMHHHPGWGMRLWTDENLPPMIQKQVFDRCRTYAEKADVVRYELLLRFGGIYVDTDFECLKNLEELLEGVSVFAVTEKWQFVNNAIIGAVPGHPFLKEVVDGLPASFQAHPRNQLKSTGPSYFTRCVYDYLDRNPGRVHIFERDFFYPYAFEDRLRPREDYPWAYAVHYWAFSWGAYWNW